MASALSFPNPYLVAILFVCTTRTGSGAQVLFQYPSNSLSADDISADELTASDETDDATSTDSDQSTTDDDDHFAVPASGTATYSQVNASGSKLVVEEDERPPTNGLFSQNGSRHQHNRTMFGLAEDGLVSLLSPDRTWHKRKFEMGINDLTFVGRPVFVRTDGTWRKEKKRKAQAHAEDPTMSETATDDDSSLGAENSSQPGDQASSNRQTVSETKSSLTMFHTVFVMNPPPLEHTVRVKDMYDHVIKKFSRNLKWDQAHNDYVWKEAEKISMIKASGLANRSTLASIFSDILTKSSLATAISNVYTAISNSRIASIVLSPKVSFSLQIPLVTSTSSLPSLTDPPIQPGLWITTATDVATTGNESEEADPGHALHLAKHYTLLLKSPPHRIAKDALEAGGPLAAHLPKFVSSLRPTKSFHKLSASCQISLADIQLLAHHLIYWRRAVLIPPLHQKDIYIVSPNADMRKLREATKSYEQQFASTMPNMPSLPKILHALSGTPKPFGSLIPSTDHKEIYYFALAWLMRNGWVTQLRTFGYVRVDADAKRVVKETKREAKTGSSVPNKSQREDGDAGREHVKPRQRPSIISRPSSDGRRSYDGYWPSHNPRMASLILNPPRASPEESRWLEYIENSLTTGNNCPYMLSAEDKTDLQRYWPVLMKYLNGHVALETVPVREGLKRKFFWGMLQKIGLELENGVEDDARGNKAVLLAVRHW